MAVKGALVDVQALTSYLRQKLKRSVEVVPAKIDQRVEEKRDREPHIGNILSGKSGGNKEELTSKRKEKDTYSIVNGGDGKENIAKATHGGGGSESGRKNVTSKNKKKDIYSIATGGSAGGGANKDKVVTATPSGRNINKIKEDDANNNKVEANKLDFYDGFRYYQVESPQDYMRFMTTYMMRGPQIFSDENPNAYCSIM